VANPRNDSFDAPDLGGEEFGGGGGGRRFARFARARRGVKPEEPLDYKNIAYLSKLLTPQGKIMSRKRTGFSGQDQRQLARAVKLARFLGLLAYVG
jgi:ribosomal protein S18